MTWSDWLSVTGNPVFVGDFDEDDTTSDGEEVIAVARRKVRRISLTLHREVHKPGPRRRRR